MTYDYAHHETRLSNIVRRYANEAIYWIDPKLAKR